MRSQGYGYRKISRELNLSKNTVKKWLRDPEYVENRYGVNPNKCPVGIKLHVRSSSPMQELNNIELPDSWQSWHQVKAVKKLLPGLKYLLATNDTNLDEKKQKRMVELLESPIGNEVAIILSFAQEWYSIWSDSRAAQSIKVAREKWEKFISNEKFFRIPPLRTFLRKLTGKLFDHLSYFLFNESWEATSNGAERFGRKFRKFQKERYNLRTKESISLALGRLAIGKYAMQKQTRNNLSFVL